MKSLLRRRSIGLGPRLGLMVMMGLLPLGVLSVIQTSMMIDQANTTRYEAMTGETLRLAEDEISAVRAAETTARILAHLVPPLVDDLAACRAMMDAAARSEPSYSLVAFVPLSGEMRCASGGHEQDMTSSPIFQRMIEQPRPRQMVNDISTVTGDPVLATSHPVHGPDGRWIGVVNVSIRQAALQSLPLDQETDEDAGKVLRQSMIGLISFDTTGTTLTSTLDDDKLQGELPAVRGLGSLSSDHPHSFVAESAAGQRRLYSVIPLVDGLNFVGIWRPPGGNVLTAVIAPWALPALMWMAGLLVALVGAERLVLRHLRPLSRTMRTFSQGGLRGHHQLEPLDGAPAEIEALTSAFATMTETILRDEAELENLVHQKQRLLREVHHRTGNSLQLIASLLRMHRREAADPDMRSVLDNLHDRVMYLSTVHLGLYRVAGRDDVDVDQLMADVVARITSAHRHQSDNEHPEIVTELSPLQLGSQQAVPLTLLLAELISTYAAPSSVSWPRISPQRLHIVLAQPEAGRVTLTVTGPAGARGTLLGQHQGAPAVIASRLLRGFVAQINGTLQISEEEAGQVTTIVTFPILTRNQQTDPTPPGTTAPVATGQGVS